VKRPSNSNGDEANRFPQAADELSASSPARRIGETIIPFPAPPQLPGREGAGVTSASASSTFIPLSEPVRAVVMRLQGRFPRIKVLVPIREEDDRDQL
jgi:hypothetical protein